MKFTLKMVFLLIPLTIVLVLSAVVVTVYLLINASRVKKSVEYDDPIFLES